MQKEYMNETEYLIATVEAQVNIQSNRFIEKIKAIEEKDIKKKEFISCRSIITRVIISS